MEATTTTLESKRPAAGLVVAPRMPSFPKTYSDPFSSDGDVVADCASEGCGWHAMGTRAEVKKAWQAHHKMYHSTDIGVVLLNQPRQ